MTEAVTITSLPDEGSKIHRTQIPAADDIYRTTGVGTMTEVATMVREDVLLYPEEQIERSREIFNKVDIEESEKWRYIRSPESGDLIRPTRNAVMMEIQFLGDGVKLATQNLAEEVQAVQDRLDRDAFISVSGAEWKNHKPGQEGIAMLNVVGFSSSVVAVTTLEANGVMDAETTRAIRSELTTQFSESIREVLGSKDRHTPIEDENAITIDITIQKGYEERDHLNMQIRSLNHKKIEAMWEHIGKTFTRLKDDDKAKFPLPKMNDAQGTEGQSALLVNGLAAIVTALTELSYTRDIEQEEAEEKMTEATERFAAIFLKIAQEISQEHAQQRAMNVPGR